MSDPVIVTAVVIVTALAIANAAYAHRSTRRLLDVIDALEARLLRVESAARKGAPLVDAQNDYIQLKNATFIDGRWNVQVCVFAKDGRFHKTVFVGDLSEATIREAVYGH